MVQMACMIMPEGPVGQIVDVAVEAERLGFARVWIPDEGIAGRDCYVALAAIATKTQSVQIGTGITSAYTRHPGVTAAAVASIDELSNGRGVLGIGAGGGLTLGPLAIQRVKPLTAMRDLAMTARGLWSGAPVTHSSETGSFENARLGFGRANIPIWFAGRGPKVMALGGEIADGFILSYLHKDLIASHVGAIRAAASTAGRPAPTLAYMTMLATDDASYERTRAALTFRLVDSPDEVKNRLGLGSAEVQALRSAIAAGGPSAAAHLIRDEWIDQFAIVGSPDECRRELHALLNEHDLDEFQVSVNDLGIAHDVLATATAIVN